MKNYLLVLTCLIISFWGAFEGLSGKGYDLLMAEFGQKIEDGISLTNSSLEKDGQLDDLYLVPTDVMYDADAIALQTTYRHQHDDLIPLRLNQWGRQLRVLVLRVQFRCYSIISHVKKIFHLLSVHLTTLIQHISQYYSTLKPLSWKYAVECYVFAFRHIII